MDKPKFYNKVPAERILMKIRKMTAAELEAEGWDDDNCNQSIALEFADGSIIIASQDEEGNGPGALFKNENGKSYYLFSEE
jgi:hypothetical protein